MAIIAAVWQASSPTPDERGAIELLRLASRLPLTPEEALDGLLAIGLDEPSAERAIELAGSVSLVRRKVVPDLGTYLLYDEYLFGHAIDRTAEAIGRMRPIARRRSSRCWRSCTRTRVDRQIGSSRRPRSW